MTLEGELRDVLAEEADRRDAPAPDLAALRAGGLNRRRRRRRLVVASSALAAVLCVGVGVGLATGQWDTAGRAAGPPAGAASEVPWCVPAPDRAVEQLIEGEGAPIATLCRSFRVARLWHHAGTTVLTLSGTTYRVADGPPRMQPPFLTDRHGSSFGPRVADPAVARSSARSIGEGE